MNRIRPSLVASAILMFLANPLCDSVPAADTVPHTVVTIFSGDQVRFNPDSSATFSTDSISATDNGRAITRSVLLPPADTSSRIIAHLVVNPIPKDEQSVCDPWDRAGNVRLSAPDQPDLELVKFITAYGGRTEYSVDMTDLAPALTGQVTVSAWIDTWLSPAWTVDLELQYVSDHLEKTSRWVLPVLYEQAFTREAYGDSGLSVMVDVPAGQERILMHYYTSGHCTDGRDEDEFVTKDNVISVDGIVVYRFRPWRDDCRDFRANNPYTRRWSDGWWSSDYSRSGWCPSDLVTPLELDLTDHLTPGKHSIRVQIENVRPKDESGHYGYWRVSANLIGVEK